MKHLLLVVAACSSNRAAPPGPASASGAAASAASGASASSGASGASGATASASGSGGSAGTAAGLGSAGADVAAGSAVSAGGASVASLTSSVASGNGDLIVHVVWPDAPASTRAEGPRNPCGVARRSRATIGTLHGVSRALVIVSDVAAAQSAGAAAPASATSSAASGSAAVAAAPASVSATKKPGQPGSSKARATTPSEPAPELVLRDCRLEPTLVMLARGADLTIASADARPHRVTLADAGSPRDVDGWRAADPRGAIDLPWTGAEVAVPPSALAAPAVWRLAADTAPDDVAWVVIPADDSRAAITDDAGAVTLTALPAGKRHVLAWLPERGDGAQTRIATVDVDVVAGRVQEVVLSFGGAASPVAGSAAAPAPGATAP